MSAVKLLRVTGRICWAEDADRTSSRTGAGFIQLQGDALKAARNFLFLHHKHWNNWWFTQTDRQKRSVRRLLLKVYQLFHEVWFSCKCPECSSQCTATLTVCNSLVMNMILLNKTYHKANQHKTTNWKQQQSNTASSQQGFWNRYTSMQRPIFSSCHSSNTLTNAS